MHDLAVIIINWNTRDLVLEALESLLNDVDGLDAAVYVVDNASSDGSVAAIGARFPQVNLTASQENLGFVGGNNLAMRQIGFGNPTVKSDDLPRAVYLLNSDTVTQPGATKALYDALMTDNVGLVGARLTYGDGSFQHSAFGFPGLRQLWAELFPTPGRFIEGRFNGRYPKARYEAGDPFPVDFVLGATMMLRREVIQQVGMFDDDFFMYCEEIDWAWRIHKAGWRVQCVPVAHVVHLAGQSTSQVKPLSAMRLWTSRRLLFRKHYPAWKRLLAHRLVIAGMSREIRQARVDMTLSDDERRELIETYQEIQRVYQS